jgi:hypothetical protein
VYNLEPPNKKHKPGRAQRKAYQAQQIASELQEAKLIIEALTEANQATTHAANLQAGVSQRLVNFSFSNNIHSHQSEPNIPILDTPVSPYEEQYEHHSPRFSPLRETTSPSQFGEISQDTEIEEQVQYPVQQQESLSLQDRIEAPVNKQDHHSRYYDSYRPGNNNRCRGNNRHPRNNNRRRGSHYRPHRHHQPHLYRTED